MHRACVHAREQHASVQARSRGNQNGTGLAQPICYVEAAHAPLPADARREHDDVDRPTSTSTTLLCAERVRVGFVTTEHVVTPSDRLDRAIARTHRTP